MNVKTGRTLSGLMLWASALLAGCGTVSITAETRGQDGTAERLATSLSLRRGDVESIGTPRVVEAEGRPEAERLDVLAAQLRVSVGGQPNTLSERYHFLQVLTPGDGPLGGTAVQPDFVRNRLGTLLHLEQPFAAGARQAVESGRFHVGAAWLGLVKDSHREVPWEVAPGSPRCVPLSRGDCFDMGSLSRLLFSSLATSVNDSVRAHVPGASVPLHSLHFVPHVVHQGLEAEGRRARGFGFIYHALLQLPLVTYDIHVPLSILFTDNVQNYRVLVDPVAMGRNGPGPENTDRILVRSAGPAAALEGLVRDVVRDAVNGAALPEPLPGVAFEDLVVMGLNGAAGANPPLSGQPPRITPQYDLLLLPEPGTTSTLLWERQRSPDLIERGRVRLAFIE